MRGVSITLTLILLFFLAVSASAQNGRITGKLLYPGDAIPRDLILCIVTSTGAETTLCSNSSSAELKRVHVLFKVDRIRRNYQVDLPAGRYMVYSKTREMAGHEAFYNDYVKCGMQYTCRSQKPIVLVVRPGKTLKGIDVGDYWNVG